MRGAAILLPIAAILAWSTEIQAYQLGATIRTLGASNNGEYFESGADIGLKGGIFFQPDYFFSPYLEWVYLDEEFKILPIIGFRIRPDLAAWWVRPRVGLNLYPAAAQFELEASIRRIRIGAYLEILNWGDQGWLSTGLKAGYHVPFPIE